MFPWSRKCICYWSAESTVSFNHMHTFKFTLITSSNLSSSIFKMKLSRNIPAQLTTTEGGALYFESMFWRPLCTLFLDDTSISRKWLFPFKDSATSFTAVTLLSAAITIAPSRFNNRQTALPMPLPAPNIQINQNIKKMIVTKFFKLVISFYTCLNRYLPVIRAIFPLRGKLISQMSRFQNFVKNMMTLRI